MDELLRAQAYRTLTVDGVGVFRVPPPTVRVALTIVAVSRQDEPPPSDLRHLRQVTAEWLPLTTQSIVWANRAFSQARRLHLLVSIIESGLPDSLRSDPHQEAEAEEEVEPEVKSQKWWWGQLARYRQHFSLTMSQLMSENWYAFCAHRHSLRQLEARDKLRQAEANIASDPRGENDLLTSISDAALFEDEKDQDSSESDHMMTEEEREDYVQKRKAKLARVQNFLRKN